MKLSLLDIVQLILSDGTSDEVNTIADTPESLQVANIVKETYLDIVSRANLPEHCTVFEVMPSNDPDLPVVMYLPEKVVELKWIKYDIYDGTSATNNPEYRELGYWKPEDFFRTMHMRNTSEDQVSSANLQLGDDSITLLFDNDKMPQYYTVLSDNTMVFDSYDQSIDTTLQKNKTIAYGEVEPVFTMSDSFVPSLDSKQFSLLLQESKSQYFIDLKQTQNPKAEQRARKGWINLQRKKNNFPTRYYEDYPNYSRKG